MSFKTNLPAFHAWLLSDKNRIRLVLSSREAYRHGIPVFFYSFPIFSPKDGPIVHIGSTISLRMTDTLTEENLLQFETLCANAEAAEDGRLITTLKMSIRDFLSAYEKLLGLRLYYSVFPSDTVVVFPLLERVEFDEGFVRIEFSEEISLMWYIDNVLPCSPVVETVREFRNLLTRTVVRSSIASFGSYPITLEKAANNIGYTTTFASMEMHECKNELIEKKDLLASLGLAYRDKRIEFDLSRQPIRFCRLGAEYYTKIKNRGKWNEIVEMFAKGGSHPATDRATILKITPNRRKKEPLYEIVEGAPEGSRFTVSTIKEAEGFIETAQRIFEPWVTAESLDEVFEEFREYWTQVNPACKKSWRKTWSDWLRKKGVGYSVEFFPEAVAIEHATKVGLDRYDASFAYRKFVNYYLSSGIMRKKWLPAWENWIATNIENENKRASAGALKTKVDYSFYMSKLVSETIKSKMRNKGIRPEDVVSGRYEIEGVGWKNIPVPPLGKKEETIFFYMDAAKQQSVMQSFMMEDRSIDKEKEGENYIDVQIEE